MLSSCGGNTLSISLSSCGLLISLNCFSVSFPALGLMMSINQSFEYKCEAKWYNRLPCIQNDLLKVAFRSKEKVKLVGEDANGKKQWMKSGEFENIVNCYEIIKE